jgi:outer membrane protein OmpA-like peptidoglycan-associated protein
MAAKYFRSLYVLFFLLALPTFSFSQKGEVIQLNNASFEDVPHIGSMDFEITPYGRVVEKPTLIKGWEDCGFPRETPPDIHKSGGLEGAFEVRKESLDGKTFLGMVVRDNDTWESVSQELTTSFEAGACYSFSIFIGRSTRYMSRSRVTNQSANYTTPIVLRVWGGFDFCDKKQLLGETPAVDHFDWKKYDLRLEPDKNFTHIIFEAFYKTPTLFPYNGHILIDNASAIQPIPCNEDVVAYNEPVEEEKIRINQKPGEEKGNNEPELRPKEPPVTEPVKPEEPIAKADPKPKEKIMAELDRSKIRKGQTIRIEKLYFAADSSRIEDDSHDALNEVFVFMRDNPDVIVEIGGHTNTIPDKEYCNRLSTARAKAVVEYLKMQGIPEKRLEYRGYGKSKPVVPNDKYSKNAQRRNLRVEIKILEMNG